MLFERRAYVASPTDDGRGLGVGGGALSSESLAHWNRRQATRHQYTPSLTTIRRSALRSALLGDPSGASRSGLHAAADDHAAADSVNQLRSFTPSLNRNAPAVLPRSHRQLQWEKRTHSAALAPFVDKITAAPTPQDRVVLQEMFAAGAAARREVSHEVLQRKIWGHQRAI